MPLNARDVHFIQAISDLENSSKDLAADLKDVHIRAVKELEVHPLMALYGSVVWSGQSGVLWSCLSHELHAAC